MVKLIDAEHLDASLASITPKPSGNERNPLMVAIPATIALFRKRIMDEPEVADAVVVVRCEDCRYRPTCALYAVHHELDNYCRAGRRADV